MSRAPLRAALILLVGCSTDEPAATPDFWPWDPDGGRSDGLTPPRDGRQAEAKPADAGAVTPLELAALGPGLVPGHGLLERQGRLHRGLRLRHPSSLPFGRPW